MLNDAAIFAAIVSEGGFSRAATKLGLSNGLISRRLAKLEKELGVTLLKRTTRQFQLTPEGELFWEYAKRIQQELDEALQVIHSVADKPKGDIRISAPPQFGRHHLMPMLNQFMKNFPEIKIELILTDMLLDPVKEKIDLLIRSTGFFEPEMKDSSLKTKLILKKKIKLYASSEYLIRKGIPTKPADLTQHEIIGYVNSAKPAQNESWTYSCKNKSGKVNLKSSFVCNDMDSRLAACMAGHGIGRFTEWVSKHLVDKDSLQCVLPDYDWGDIQLHAVYASQQALPKRTRLLLDFIVMQIQHLSEP